MNLYVFFLIIWQCFIYVSIIISQCLFMYVVGWVILFLLCEAFCVTVWKVLAWEIDGLNGQLIDWLLVRDGRYAQLNRTCQKNLGFPFPNFLFWLFVYILSLFTFTDNFVQPSISKLPSLAWWLAIHSRILYKIMYLFYHLCHNGFTLLFCGPNFLRK